jgi:hypothetical protein
MDNILSMNFKELKATFNNKIIDMETWEQIVNNCNVGRDCLNGFNMINRNKDKQGFNVPKSERIHDSEGNRGGSFEIKIEYIEYEY